MLDSEGRYVNVFFFAITFSFIYPGSEHHGVVKFHADQFMINHYLRFPDTGRYSGKQDK